MLSDEALRQIETRRQLARTAETSSEAVWLLVNEDVAALVNEVRRLRAEYAEAQHELRAANTEGDKVFGLLTQYGRHQEGCSGQQGPQYRCRCGWREEAAALGLGEPEEPKGPPPSQPPGVVTTTSLREPPAPEPAPTRYHKQ